MTMQTKNLTIGMTSTELVEILDACGRNGVSSIKIGEIAVELSGEPKTIDKVPTVSYNEDDTVPFNEPEEDDDIDDLLFSDPEEWDRQEQENIGSNE